MNASDPVIVAVPTSHITQQLLHDMTQHNTHDITLEQVVWAIIDAATLDVRGTHNGSAFYLESFFEPYVEMDNGDDYAALQEIIQSRLQMFRDVIQRSPNIPRDYWEANSFELINITPDGDWIIGSV